MSEGEPPASGLPIRADVALVARGLADSRAKAREAIEAGLVTLDGAPLQRPSDRVPPGAKLEAARPYPWVSRGGLKLAAALDAFGINPAGLLCLDVGASTGGFTDVLLARGAAQVVAVDVGTGQLHPKLAADPRVIAWPSTDIRRAEPVPGGVDLASVDVSFISLRLVLPALPRWLKNGAQVVLLVKPQFEVGRKAVGRGGLVRDEAAKAEAVAAVRDSLHEAGFTPGDARPSPVTGGDGNEEFLLAASFGGRDRG